MVEHLWMFAKAAGSVFTESVSYQLGFGQCSKQPRISEDAADLAMRREAALSAAEGGSSSSFPSSSSTPLLDAETAEKRSWACRLQAIARREGDFSKPAFSKSEDGILAEDEKIKLNDLVVMMPSFHNGRARSAVREVRALGGSQPGGEVRALPG